MNHWIVENVFVFVLAGFSGFDLIKRISSRIYSGIASLPMKCYLKIAASLALGRQTELQACRNGGMK